METDDRRHRHGRIWSVAALCIAIAAATASAATAASPQTQAAIAAAHISGGVLAKIPRGLAVKQTAAGQRNVALTFDDGPSPYTPQVLALLERYDQQATFFVTGLGASAYPGALRRIVADGDAFGDHTVTHAQLLREDTAKRAWELSSTAQRVEDVTGVRPTLFRPPYGSSSSEINSQARQLGFLPVIWTIDTRDWARPGVSSIVRTALRGVGPGDIILMHDGGGDRSETVAALSVILPALRDRHLQSITLPALLNAQPPRGLDLETCAC
jgi:peptidoglycan/xylan/chitin deacetylase (PgdA/CDA1 family)